MKPTDIEQYLHEHIPISMAMGVRVLEAQYHRIVLSAPLSNNINHRATVFGGSASSLAILSAWTLVHFRLLQDQIHPRLVIQNNTMKSESHS